MTSSTGRNELSCLTGTRIIERDASSQNWAKEECIMGIGKMNRLVWYAELFLFPRAVTDSHPTWSKMCVVFA